MTDLTSLIDAARAAHLIGLALGLGLALWADLAALRALFQPLGPADIAQLRRLHHAVAAGLALLWASGLAILAIRLGLAGGTLSPKLVAKLMVVAVLTLNAAAMGRLALPVLAAAGPIRFGDLAFRDRLTLAGVAAVSAASWASALTLGAFTRLKAMDAPGLWATLSPIYGVALLGAGALAVLAPLLAHAARRPPPAGDLADIRLAPLLTGRRRG